VATPPLFLADPLPAAGPYELCGSQGRHAAAVRRLRAGEELLLGDGRGGVALCVVTGLAAGAGRAGGGPAGLRLDVLRRWQVPEPAVRVVLAQALVKGERGELAVELATEAGVDAVLPWRAARCVARWDPGERGERALQRWRATAREAAKQSRRSWLPTVHEPVSTAELAARVPGVARAIVLHESADRSLAGVALPAGGDVLLVVGPEGGVADAELSCLLSAGAVAARLGPAVLRASSAAAVALGALGVMTDRWTLA
jgi:16S rRNA (uracil1498-N3)-methyltransferase